MFIVCEYLFVLYCNLIWLCVLISKYNEICTLDYYKVHIIYQNDVFKMIFNLVNIIINYFLFLKLVYIL